MAPAARPAGPGPLTLPGRRAVRLPACIGRDIIRL